jgi:hypothetical protein
MPIYEQQCDKCGKIVEYLAYAKDVCQVKLFCACGGEMEFKYSIPAVHVFQPYTTTHILPHAKPITITSARHEASVLRENGLVKADSNPTK